MFGPRIGNAEEAGELVRRGAGEVLATPAAARDHVARLLSDDTARTRLGRQARQVVLEQRGATARSMAVIAPWLDAAPPRT
jgi:3-deoxy-D-manno-octulosonic-acid transferase